MTENSITTEAENKRETMQLERELLRDKIKELIESEYARLEEAAAEIAPEFDYEAESQKLKAEEAEELGRLSFEWADEKPAESAAAEEEAEESSGQEPEPEEELKEEPEEEPEKKEYGPLPEAVVSPSRYLKPRRVPGSAAGRALFGDRHRTVFTAAMFLLIMFAAYQAWDYLVPKTVNIRYVTYAGTESMEYATTARTAGEVMDELTAEGSGAKAADGGSDFSVSESDLLDTDESLPVRSGMTVEIRHAEEAEAKIAGKTQTIMLVPGTVKENLELNGVSFDDDDEIRPALDSKVSDKTSITVDEVHYDVVEKKEIVEAVDRVILDPSLTSGVQETTEGNDGEGIFTYTTRFVNGKEEGTEREVKEWITEPHDNVLRLGTSATGNSGEYIVVREFTANTTAYTARAGARGALGMGVHLGTCAVDPGFVSLRSELWIEDYGYAFANDTGGAVKGNVVDLYMTSNAQCIRWGRRNKTAYVIVPAE